MLGFKDKDKQFHPIESDGVSQQFLPPTNTTALPKKESSLRFRHLVDVAKRNRDALRERKAAIHANKSMSEKEKKLRAEQIEEKKAIAESVIDDIEKLQHGGRPQTEREKLIDDIDKKDGALPKGFTKQVRKADSLAFPTIFAGSSHKLKPKDRIKPLTMEEEINAELSKQSLENKIIDDNSRQKRKDIDTDIPDEVDFGNATPEDIAVIEAY